MLKIPRDLSASSFAWQLFIYEIFENGRKRILALLMLSKPFSFLLVMGIDTLADETKPCLCLTTSLRIRPKHGAWGAGFLGIVQAARNCADHSP